MGKKCFLKKKRKEKKKTYETGQEWIKIHDMLIKCNTKFKKGNNVIAEKGCNFIAMKINIKCLLLVINTGVMILLILNLRTPTSNQKQS